MDDYPPRTSREGLRRCRESPLESANNLSRRLNNHVAETEDLQPVFPSSCVVPTTGWCSSPSRRERGVIAASAGNHAQGVALSASHLQCRAVIVMPVTTPSVKVDVVRQLGGEVVLHGETYDEACAEAIRRSEDEGLCFIHPFDDPEVIAGQGTVGMEILRQCQTRLTRLRGHWRWGADRWDCCLREEPVARRGGDRVEPHDAAAMTLSLEAGERIRLPQVGLFADGVVREVETPSGPALRGS